MMGLTQTRIKLHGPDPSRSKEVELLVDTGSLYTWLDSALLRELGVRPLSRRTFRTIEGRTLERETGEAVFEFDSVRATSVVVFAQKEDVQVLGVVALESMGLEVDPVHRRLKKVEALPAF